MSKDIIMTHPYITSRTLRSAYASELWAMRKLKKALPKRNFAMVRFGLESGIWAVQQVLNNDSLSVATDT